MDELTDLEITISLPGIIGALWAPCGLLYRVNAFMEMFFVNGMSDRDSSSDNRFGYLDFLKIFLLLLAKKSFYIYLFLKLKHVHGSNPWFISAENFCKLARDYQNFDMRI